MFPKEVSFLFKTSQKSNIKVKRTENLGQCYIPNNGKDNNLTVSKIILLLVSKVCK